MHNQSLISFLQDIYSLPDVVIFCEMNSYYHLLEAKVEDTTDDHWYDYQWFKDKAQSLKDELTCK